MSFFAGGSFKSKPQFTGLSTQTSTSALAIPLAWGKNRLAPNIFWQGDFQSHKHKQKAGKGGPKIESYTYSASYELGLCWGEINDVTRVWKDQSKETSYAALGFSLFKGTTPQDPWGYLVSAHPDQALGYPGIAHLDVANYDLGQTNSLPQHSFEVESLRFNTGYNAAGLTDGADPAMIITDFLSDLSFGVGFNMDVFDQDSLYSTVNAPTTGDNAFQTYCRAIGFSLSPCLTGQSPAGETLQRWANLCNTAVVWTGYSLKLFPRGSDEITNNGVKYVPEFPIRYSLTDKDFQYQDGQDPIRFDRTDPADCCNRYSIIIANKDNEYNDLPISWQDQGLIDQYGVRKKDNLECKEVTEPAMAAIMVAYMGQYEAYIRNSFNFVLPVRFCRLEPMDVVQCYDVRLGSFSVLITDVEEQDDDSFNITAEEYHGSVSGAVPDNATMPVENTPTNTSVAPGPVNPPIIFEPPSSLAGSTAQVWAAVSGGDGTTFNPNWGGAYVWISTDNIEYNQVGTADQARMGKLSSILATYGGANPDTVHTLEVDLLMSGSELSDAASPTDAANGVTVSYVDGEFISYETVNLTSPYNYDLDNLYRGQYGSTISAHAIDSEFARLDDNIFKFNLPANYIGIPLYIKFQSFNIFGNGVEDLSTCTVYNFTPAGTGFGTGVDGLPVQTTSVSGSAGASFAKVTWTANPANDNITSYQIWRAPGSGSSFGSATLIGTAPAGATEYTDASVANSTAYTYFVVPVNAAGSGPNSAGVNLTTSGGGGGGVTLWNVFATGTGASQGVTIPYANPNEIGVFVFVNGIRYETDEYSISGTTLTLTTNASGDSIEIVGVTS